MVNSIYCVGRNYAEHASELGNKVELEPVIFSKPNSSLIIDNSIILPSFSDDVHYETELVIRISEDCYRVSEEESFKFYDAVAIGLDLTARDLQSKLKEKKLPWLLSKGFKGSCYISEFIDKDNLSDTILFMMTLNGTMRQVGDTQDMIFSFSKIISFVSQFISLRQGDVIFTGTPSGVGRLSSGDKVNLFIDGKPMSELDVL